VGHIAKYANTLSNSAETLFPEDMCSIELKVTDWCAGQVVHVPVAANGLNLSSLVMQNAWSVEFSHRAGTPISAIPPQITFLPLTSALDPLDRVDLVFDSPSTADTANSVKTNLTHLMKDPIYDSKSLVAELQSKSFYYNTNICDASYMSYNSSILRVSDADMTGSSNFRTWQSSTSKVATLNKGFVFKGAMRLVPGAMSTSSSLKFATHIFNGPEIVSTEITFAIKKHGVSCTVSGSDRAYSVPLRLNGNASDLSWVFQVSAHGEIYCVINKNDDDFGVEFSVIDPVLTAKYASKDQFGNPTYYGTASVIGISIANIQGNVDAAIITDFDAKPNPTLNLKSDQSIRAFQPWNAHELRLATTKVLKNTITSDRSTAARTLTLPSDTYETSCHMSIMVRDIRRFASQRPAEAVVLFEAASGVKLTYKTSDPSGMYFCNGDNCLAVTSIAGILSLEQIRNEETLLFSYACHAGNHQVYFCGMNGEHSYGSARLKTALGTKIAKITLPQPEVDCTVLSRADVSSSNNPYFKSGIDGFLKKKTGMLARENGVGIASSHIPASFNLRNINVGKIYSVLKPIAFGDGSTKKASMRCPSMIEFTEQNCEVAKRIDGKTFYLGKRDGKCSVVEKCEGGMVKDDRVTTENVYQTKEEKSMLSWMHFFHPKIES
jgi:hypothetical protein